MISCLRATALASRALDAPIGFKDWFRLRLHLRFCRRCRACSDQMQWLRMASRAFVSGETAGRDVD
jgi:hypothetical protein